MNVDAVDKIDDEANKRVYDDRLSAWRVEREREREREREKRERSREKESDSRIL